MTDDELREIKDRWSCNGNGCATHEELGTSHGIECPKMTDHHNDIATLLAIIDGLRERNAGLEALLRRVRGFDEGRAILDVIAELDGEGR